jgi:hypothetical protein
LDLFGLAWALFCLGGSVSAWGDLVLELTGSGKCCEELAFLRGCFELFGIVRGRRDVVDIVRGCFAMFPMCLTLPLSGWICSGLLGGLRELPEVIGD